MVSRFKTYEPKEVLVSSPASSATNLLTTTGATRRCAFISPKDPEGSEARGRLHLTDTSPKDPGRN
eukprot:7261962-Pyramimonas_sp.AAC.2